MLCPASQVCQALGKPCSNTGHCFTVSTSDAQLKLSEFPLCSGNGQLIPFWDQFSNTYLELVILGVHPSPQREKKQLLLLFVCLFLPFYLLTKILTPFAGSNKQGWVYPFLTPNLFSCYHVIPASVAISHLSSALSKARQNKPTCLALPFVMFHIQSYEANRLEKTHLIVIQQSEVRLSGIFQILCLVLSLYFCGPGLMEEYNISACDLFCHGSSCTGTASSLLFPW